MTRGKLLLAGAGVGAGWLVSVLSGCCDCEDLYLEVEPGEYQVTDGKEGLKGGAARVTEKELTVEYEHGGSRYLVKYTLDEGIMARPVRMTGRNR